MSIETTCRSCGEEFDMRQEGCPACGKGLRNSPRAHQKCVKRGCQELALPFFYGTCFSHLGNIKEAE
jgi:hypothetical protein